MRLLRSLTAGLLATLAVACGGDSTGTTPSGELVVVINTAGHQHDPNGYTLSFGTLGDSAVTTQDTLRAEVPPGTYLAMEEGDDLPPATLPLTLGGVASNCHVLPGALPAIVTDGGADTLGFAVNCDSTFGSITVNTTTTGGAPDPDGYEVQIDGVSKGTAPVNGTLIIESLALGNRVVHLGGLAGNCVLAEATDTLTVVAAMTTSVDYTVACPAPSVVRVRVTTTGSYLDPDGYTVTLPGLTPSTATAQDTLHLTTPQFGLRTVSLTGVVANCAAADSAVEVTTAPGDTVDAQFAVSCVPPALVVASNHLLATGYDLFLINPDGTNLSNLLVTAGTQMSPRWIPGTMKVLYVDTPEAGRHWNVIDAVTGAITPLGAATDKFQNLAPTPNGLTLVGAAPSDTAPFPPRLYRIGLDGNGKARVTPDPISPATPTVSSDGATLFFDGIAAGDTVYRVYSVPLSGGAATPLATTGAHPVGPAAAPAGDSIAYFDVTGPLGGVAMTDQAWNTPRTVPGTGGSVDWLSLAWDPTGKFLATVRQTLTGGPIHSIAIVRVSDGSTTILNATFSLPNSVDWRK
jgi:hypothetical protein